MTIRKMQVNGFYRDIEIPDAHTNILLILLKKYNELTGESEAYNYR